MILSDGEIRAQLKLGLIRIEPKPSDSRYTSTTVDLTLHDTLLLWQPETTSPSGIPYNTVRPSRFDIQKLMNDVRVAKKFKIDPDNGYKLLPQSFILGFTQEKIQLPHYSRIAARVEGKSSLARVGVGVHVTAPTIHAGFGFDAQAPEKPGLPIQLEIFNLGAWTVTLDVGMPICQLILEEVRETPIHGYAGQFQTQQAFTL